MQLGAGCTYTLARWDNNWFSQRPAHDRQRHHDRGRRGDHHPRRASAPGFRFFFVGANIADPGTENYVSPGAGKINASRT